MKKSDNLVLCHDIYGNTLLTYCCGVLEIGDLELHFKNDDKDLQDFEVNPENLLKNNDVGLILATTTTVQKTINIKLLEIGFKELERAKNTKTKNTIILWCYKKNKTVKKKVTKC